MNDRNKDGVAKNLQVIADQWRECFVEIGRNAELFFRCLVGKAEFRPIHYLWGIWTAFVGIPYRTWAFVFAGLFLWAAFSPNAEAQPSLSEYKHHCPVPDFGPWHPVCYQYRIVKVCGDNDFGPNLPDEQRQDCREVLCPRDLDFGPINQECERGQR